MKKLLCVAAERTSTALYGALALALVFWFAASPIGLAQSPDQTCQVCHKRTTTISTVCGSLDYQRHIDHGDAMGPCNVTPTQNP